MVQSTETDIHSLGILKCRFPSLIYVKTKTSQKQYDKTAPVPFTGIRCPPPKLQESKLKSGRIQLKM